MRLGLAFYGLTVPMKNHFGAPTIPLSVRPVIPIQRPEAICSWPNVLRNHWRNRRNERPPNERFAAFAVPPETRIEAASLCDSMRPCFRAATFFSPATSCPVSIITFTNYSFAFRFRSDEDPTLHCVVADCREVQSRKSESPRKFGNFHTDPRTRRKTKASTFHREKIYLKYRNFEHLEPLLILIDIEKCELRVISNIYTTTELLTASQNYRLILFK